ncbi:MAG: hypothetical protein AAFR88_04545 [Pseudomonadota bacterium]
MTKRRALRSQFGLALIASLSLAACGAFDAEESAGIGGVSEGEAAALEEAAAMLDAKRIPEGALPDVDPPPVEALPSDTPQEPEPTSSDQ